MTTMSAGVQEGPWPERFGPANGDSIVPLRRHGNPTYARGAFGEISVGLLRSSSSSSSKNDNNNNNNNTAPIIKLVALKTIHQTTTVVVPTISDHNNNNNNNNTQQEEQRVLNPDVYHEIQALQTLQPHPNIVRLLALYPAKENDDDPMMVGSHALTLAFEYCPIDLYMALEWRRRRRRMPSSTQLSLSMDAIRLIASDLFAALQHCHAAHHLLVHRDVKPSNLLVSSSFDGSKIKLCDFGLARPLSTNHNTNNNQAADKSDTDTTATTTASSASRGLCTLQYRPPEVLLGGDVAEHYYASSDIYSAGVVLAELLLLSGRRLFPGRNDLDQMTKVMACLGTPSATHWPGAKQLPHGKHLTFKQPQPPQPIADFIPRAVESPHLVEFLQSTLALDPACRFQSGAEAVQHAWLSSSSSQSTTAASRQELQRELIPQALDEPFLFASSHTTNKNDNNNDDNNLSIATRQALSLAARRRTFLKNLDVWTEFPKTNM